MSTFIPKDRGSGYRPWTLKSLDGGRGSKGTATPAPPPDQKAREAERRAQADRVAAINRDAYREGYEAGYASGEAAVREQAARLASVVDAAQHDLSRVDDETTRQLVALALSLARTVVRRALELEPAIIEAVVREVAAAMQPFRQGVRLRLNPADVPLVAERLANELGPDWTLVEDVTIERGGCRAESAACDMDATLESRWQRVAAALGQDDEGAP